MWIYTSSELSAFISNSFQVMGRLYVSILGFDNAF